MGAKITVKVTPDARVRIPRLIHYTAHHPTWAWRLGGGGGQTVTAIKGGGPPHGEPERVHFRPWLSVNRALHSCALVPARSRRSVPACCRGATAVCTSPLLASTPTCAFMPKYH